MADDTSTDAVAAATHPVRSLAVQHAEVRSKLQKTVSELADQENLLRQLTEDCSKKESQVTIVKQKIRSTNETLFGVKSRTSQNQTQHDELVGELGAVKCALEMTRRKIEKVEAQRVDFQVEKAIHEDNVRQVEMSWKGQEGIVKEMESMQRDVEVYQDYKRRLAAGDAELKKILSGEMYTLAVRKGDGIRDAIAEREAKAEMVYLDIDEKKETNDKLRQKLQITEKHNAARLKQLKREISEKTETEAHLKQTVEYLEKRLDHGVRMNSSANPNDDRVCGNVGSNSMVSLERCNNTQGKSYPFHPPGRV